MTEGDGGVLRTRDESRRVSLVELFFDLVYVLAVTQLTHLLLDHLTLRGVAEAGILLFAIWWAWQDTAWLANWVDPDRLRMRALLLSVMGASLVMSASIPEAYGDRGLWFAAAYATMQVGRSAYAVVLLRADTGMRRNFLRILPWRTLSAGFWVAGGLSAEELRLGLWAVAAAVDTGAAAIGFYLPKLGRSGTRDWPITGSHLAERSRLLMIIALGESILITGAVFGDVPPTGLTLAAFGAAFGGTVALWWIYFDRAAEAASDVIAGADDPGGLGRSAYTYYHIPMVAGIIVTAVGDDLALHHPGDPADTATIASVLGGPALFLAGYLLFKRAVFGVLPAPLLVALAALAALVPAGPHLEAVTLSWAATGVVGGAAIWHAIGVRRHPPRLPHPQG
ncbi:low temperature requirement protein A [Solwaraspora sp. WMMD1047]|uniref:low temperature requirement protein A n=1 Tax=Solwaraspora sp. WMMD1047 TaxID=3016102 RepID=UPI0024170F6F|nr:low temperature requirement protein A [Solwaraspora sp. WMMD1047]MDG4829153.1 low temperature requirement protein A [Solwaraspora sp. WMMD1047]